MSDEDIFKLVNQTDDTIEDVEPNRSFHEEKEEVQVPLSEAKIHKDSLFAYFEQRQLFDEELLKAFNIIKEKLNKNSYKFVQSKLNFN